MHEQSSSLDLDDQPSVSPESLVEITGPEIVFALVGPVGTDLGALAERLQRALRSVEYESHIVQASDLIPSVLKFQHLADKEFDSAALRSKDLMAAGSDIRRGTGHANALALLMVSEIQRIRRVQNLELLETEDPTTLSLTPLARTAFIVKSLKNPAEVKTLQDVYGRAFFVIAAYSPHSQRVNQLAHKIARSVDASDTRRYIADAETLVSIDEKEGDQYGQNVRDSFPMADLFVDTTNSARLDQELQRFVEILFGNPFKTPSKDEFSMFHAFAAALRSADPSRQVGAAIADSEGKILAVGCNDIPKFGGGLYWQEDENDSRDFVLGSDAGTTTRIDMLSETLSRLGGGGLLNDQQFEDKSYRQIAEDLLSGKRKDVMKGSQTASIIEFGRAVHAEMAAICDAAQRGISVKDATLYCTTFPCHLCARHIIASGIKRVVYIEPYPKSNAAVLYKDSICVDPQSAPNDRVIFRSFVGIAPRVYSFMFTMNEDNRKNPDGSITEWEASGECSPRLRRFVMSYMAIEDLIQKDISRIFTGEYEIIDNEVSGVQHEAASE